MIVVGNLLATNPQHGLLIGFNDPDRDLNWNTPVLLLPAEAEPYRMIDLVDSETGQIIPGCHRFGPAIFTITQHTWDMLPSFVATVVAERERHLAADRAELERAAKQRFRARREREQHDQQIRAQRKRQKRNPNQGTLL